MTTERIAPEHRPAVTYRRHSAQPVNLTADQRQLWESIKALPLN